MRLLSLSVLLLAALSARADEGDDAPVTDEALADAALVDPHEPAVAEPPLEVDDPVHLRAIGLVSGGDPSLQGLRFAVAPRVAPGAAVAPAGLATVAAHLVEGHADAALAAAEALAPRLHGREAAAVWMAAGMLHREAGRANLASEAFTRVRLDGGPLAAFAGWYEAEQDLARGRAAVAVRECEAYLAAWPEGWHADDCSVLIAFAHARLGHADPAITAARAFDEAHPKEPIEEQVTLALAHWEADHAPERAVARLRVLATWFRAPLTGRLATQGLAAMAARGIEGATVPHDLGSRKARAVSLRESGRLDEAWALFETLASEAHDDPALAAWIEGELTTFAWRTRRYDVLVDVYQQRLAETSDPGDAWLLYRALDRAGRYPEAAASARDGLQRFHGQRPWRGEDERIGRTMMLAGAYDDARRLFDGQASRRGNTGARNAYYAAFSAVMRGDREDALTRLAAIVDGNRGGLETEARYWRARLLGASEPERAADDLAWIREHASSSWYGILVRATDPAALTHDGRWRGELGPAPDPTRLLTGAPSIGRLAHGEARAGADGLATLGWPLSPSLSPSVSPVSSPLASPARPVADPCEPRSDYRACRFYAPELAEQDFDAFVARYAETWPELLAVQDLARVGLHDLSGPLMARIYDDWRREARDRHPVARQVLSRMEPGDWRDLFLHARDHHHATKSSYRLAGQATSDERADVASLALPLAHRRQVWRSGATYGIDPLLVLGVMRTESIYDANAISRAGARGAMQIMPRTGHLVADRTHDVGFHTGRLHDPELAIDYGVRYLGLLMQRFDGVFPLAVASYNGGPHNVSSWLQGTGADVPIDVFVEHIPFGETRRYVRAVTERYAAYVRLYDHGRVVLPEHVLGDHPEVVDF